MFKRPFIAEELADLGDEVGPDPEAETPVEPVDEWPAPPDPAAYAGRVGEFLDVVMPDTEGDPAAVAMTLLLFSGVTLGRRAYVQVGRQRHGTNIFAIVVGPTVIGAKGSGLDHPLDALAIGREGQPHLVTGLGSGEALVERLRDPAYRLNKKTDVYEVVDEGVPDKRAVVHEPEMARLLRAAGRDGSTLTSYLREAWDGRTLNVVTRARPVTATDPHIGALYHVTPDELRRELAAGDLFNGFVNRFFFVASRRSKRLPLPPVTEGPAWERIVFLLRQALADAPSGRIGLGPDGASHWATVILPSLEGDRSPIMEAITARARPQLLRLALIYALLDGEDAIGTRHLRSALAMWQYSERTAAWLFSDTLGNPEADRILAALQESDPVGLTRTHIRDLFNRHAPEAAISAALRLLTTRRLARVERTPNPAGRGRPLEIWHPCDRNDISDRNGSVP